MGSIVWGVKNQQNKLNNQQKINKQANKKINKKKQTYFFCCCFFRSGVSPHHLALNGKEDPQAIAFGKNNPGALTKALQKSTLCKRYYSIPEYTFFPNVFNTKNIYTVCISLVGSANVFTFGSMIRSFTDEGSAYCSKIRVFSERPVNNLSNTLHYTIYYISSITSENPVNNYSNTILYYSIPYTMLL
jgi:hypothetical protein